MPWFSQINMLSKEEINNSHTNLFFSHFDKKLYMYTLNTSYTYRKTLIIPISRRSIISHSSSFYELKITDKGQLKHFLANLWTLPLLNRFGIIVLIQIFNVKLRKIVTNETDSRAWPFLLKYLGKKDAYISI